jgi:hypothetical protein
MRAPGPDVLAANRYWILANGSKSGERQIEDHVVLPVGDTHLLKHVAGMPAHSSKCMASGLVKTRR